MQFFHKEAGAHQLFQRAAGSRLFDLEIIVAIDETALRDFAVMGENIGPALPIKQIIEIRREI